MGILLLLSVGLNVVLIAGLVRRERRRLREEHKRYRRAFMENLRRIHADLTPGLPEARKGRDA